jgi:hypothetical protein
LCPADRSRIVRLGPLYGTRLSKGVLMDIALHRTVYLDPRSRYAFTPVGWAAERIVDGFAFGSGLAEVGACGAVELGVLAAACGSRCAFDGPVEHQEFDSPDPGSPAAWDALPFVKNLMS